MKETDDQPTETATPRKQTNRENIVEQERRIIQLERDLIAAQARAESAEAACAEMREALRHTHPAEIWDKARMYYTSGHHLKTMEHPIVEWHRLKCEQVDKAITPTSGTATLERLRELEGEVERLKDGLFEMVATSVLSIHRPEHMAHVMARKILDGHKPSKTVALMHEHMKVRDEAEVERDALARENERLREEIDAVRAFVKAVRAAEPYLKTFENMLASSLSCDSRSHDNDREPRRRINDVLNALAALATPSAVQNVEQPPQPK